VNIKYNIEYTKHEKNYDNDPGQSSFSGLFAARAICQGAMAPRLMKLNAAKSSK
jgi:hypothetical protein